MTNVTKNKIKFYYSSNEIAYNCSLLVLQQRLTYFAIELGLCILLTIWIGGYKNLSDLINLLINTVESASLIVSRAIIFLDCRQNMWQATSLKTKLFDQLISK